MKKRFFSLLIAITATVFGFSQLTLPTSLDFTGQNIPSGWTTNPSNAAFYSGSGNPAPALKFTSTGHYLEGEFASSPREMTYDLTLNPSPSVPWNGSFEVQESVDGQTYTTIMTHDGSNTTEQNYQSFTVQLEPATRFVRFFFAQKSSGNIGLDNIFVDEASITEQDIRVFIQNEEVSPNHEAYMSADVSGTFQLPLAIHNAGSLSDLEISNIEIIGEDADQFDFLDAYNLPLTITALTEEANQIVFAPTTAGTKNASVKITSNDLDYPEFIFHLIGYGDNLATEPTAQPTDLTFSNIKTYRVMANFSASSDADGYLILRKKGEAVTEVPVDGEVYHKGDVIGDAKVAQVSSSTSFVPNEIIAGTDYHFAIFAYNGVGTGINYLTADPLVGNATTLTEMIPSGLYDDIAVESPTLVADLYGKVAPHFQHYYGDYASKMVENFYARDTINGKRVVTCQYTGNNYLYDYPFSFGGTGMSREHTFASSWFPVSDNAANFYSDYHNLLLLHHEESNEVRSNYPLGEVVSDTLDIEGNAMLGKNAQGQWVYEPTDETKGVAARAMFYMSVRYTEDGVVWSLPSHISGSVPYGQDQTVLKKWNTDFPPTNLEIARNDYIDSLQGNRNPFVDHPEYACYIDFMNMEYLVEGCESAITEEVLKQAFIVYPNPAKENLTIAVDGVALKAYRITDIEGRVVSSADVQNLPAKEVSIAHLSSGMYIVTAITELGEVSKKFVVE